MKIILRTAFTINNGEDQTKDLEVEIPSGTNPGDMSAYDRQNLAADALIEQGQIMVSSAQLQTQTMAGA